MTYEILTSFKSPLAEGPLYVQEEHAVFWTDIDSGHLHRYDLASGVAETVHSGTKIGGFTIQEDGSLILFRESGAIHRYRNREIQVLIDQIPEESATRFNDVAADPAGRVFCGTMSSDARRGRLYRLDPDGALKVILDDVGCPNGIGWTRDKRTMFFTDSSARTVYAFDYDESTGEIGNQRIFYAHEGPGTPDGMTVDAEDNLWIALWDGGALLKVNPYGQVVERHELPARKITCPSFGGPGHEELFVTTAGGHIEGDGEGAGELIRMVPGVRGKPEFRSRITKVIAS